MNLQKISHDRRFRTLIEQHAHALISYLTEKRIIFSIFCDLARVHFDPPLPQHIFSALPNMTLFVLAGYTFDSITLDEKYLYFEAGFGEENIGTLVRVPLINILRIFIQDSETMEDYMLFASPSITFDELPSIDANKEGLKNSIALLLANPENQKFKK